MGNITLTMIFQWIEKKSSMQKERESRAIDILKMLVGVKNHQIIEDKLASEICKTLKGKFN